MLTVYCVACVQVSRLEEELAKKNKALALLEEKLCSQEDYEEIKRELGYAPSVFPPYPSPSSATHPDNRQHGWRLPRLVMPPTYIHSSLLPPLPVHTD